MMLSDKELRDMMRDPRYWRDHDPEYVEKVTIGFQNLYLYGESTPKPQVKLPINCMCEASKALDDMREFVIGYMGREDYLVSNLKKAENVVRQFIQETPEEREKRLNPPIVIQSHDGAEVGLLNEVRDCLAYYSEGCTNLKPIQNLTTSLYFKLDEYLKTQPEPDSNVQKMHNAQTEPAQDDVLDALERWDQKSGTFKPKPAKGDNNKALERVIALAKSKASCGNRDEYHQNEADCIELRYKALMQAQPVARNERAVDVEALRRPFVKAPQKLADRCLDSGWNNCLEYLATKYKIVRK